MKRNVCRIFVLLWISIFFVVSLVWAEDEALCARLSNNHNNPYVASNEWLNCIIWYFTNKTSSKDDKKMKEDLWGFNTKNFVEQYCYALLWEQVEWRAYYVKDGGNWEQTFDSHQSIFTYVLCSSFEDKEQNKPFLVWGNPYLDEIFKKSNGKVDFQTLLKLKQRSSWKNQCSLVDNESLDGCDMSLYATDIYSAIMGDIFKIKYAQVLHVDQSKSDVKTLVENFMMWYFDIKKTYKDIDGDFHQTVGVLKSNLKHFKKVLDTLKLFDNEKLVPKEGECSKDVEGVVGEKFIACALHSSHWEGSSLTPSFVTMVYNEMLNYRIFQTYMKYRLNAKIENISSEDSSKEEKVREYESQYLDFEWYANLQIEATKNALATFENFNMTYPLHIWLLMYQERMKYFRDKKLSPIVTLFYSLSEKLQNVQLPS